MRPKSIAWTDRTLESPPRLNGAMSPDEKIKAWNLIDALRTPEGHSVTILCDNPDFNGQPSYAIEVCGEWTEWTEKRFNGETMLEALGEAHDAMTAYELAHLETSMD